MAADAAREIEILTPMTPQDGDAPRGSWGNPFCNSPHPTDRYTSCKRISGHDGDHTAYTFRISTLETWASTRDYDPDDYGTEIDSA
jgi:hypothetical protein